MVILCSGFLHYTIIHYAYISQASTQEQSLNNLGYILYTTPPLNISSSASVMISAEAVASAVPNISSVVRPSLICCNNAGNIIASSSTSLVANRWARRERKNASLLSNLVIENSYIEWALPFWCDRSISICGTLWFIHRHCVLCGILELLCLLIL